MNQREALLILFEATAELPETVKLRQARRVVEKRIEVLRLRYERRHRSVITAPLGPAEWSDLPVALRPGEHGTAFRACAHGVNCGAFPSNELCRGECGYCGQPVYHAYPWWTMNPDKPGAQPLHDDCAMKYFD